MKPGAAAVAAYYVSCPHCEAALMDPGTGSYMIGRDSVESFRRTSPALTAKGQVVVECFDCGTRFALPASVSRLAP